MNQDIDIPVSVTPKQEFQVDEDVLAKDFGRLYDARILTVEFDKVTQLYKYRIHFLKWNSKWDKTVFSDVLLKKTKENELEKDKINSSHKKITKISQKKTQAATDLSKEEKSLRVKMELPDFIKRTLTEDWDNIVNKDLRIPLPRKYTINIIFKDYIDSCSSEEAKKDAEDLCRGLSEYFNECFSRLLFYSVEDSQFKTACKVIKDKDPCDIYGIEHLCRLFSKLPYLFTRARINEIDLNTIIIALNKLYKFLSTHSEYFLTSNGYIIECESLPQ
ncbi:hypothetical protein WA158_000266 [Blastocystis sp. Blastoise]